jgi:hypothetical protein
MSVPLYYLASPYSYNPYDVSEEKLDKLKRYRYDCAKFAAKELMKAGYVVFSPIAYNAPWEFEDSDIGGSFDFWERFDTVFVSVCAAMIVLQLEGWNQSTGIGKEMSMMHNQGKKIYYVTIEDIVCGYLDVIPKE